MTKPQNVWMVRAGNNNELISRVEDKNAIAIGWPAMGDLSMHTTREAIKKQYEKVYLESSPARIAVNTGQIFRFAHAIASGDYILTYDKSQREVIIGIVQGNYKFDPTVFDAEYPHIREVKWVKRVSRDTFSPPARNSMGSILTVFKMNDHLAEIHRQAIGSGWEKAEPEEETEPAPPFHEDVQAKADELIADLISQLDPYDFQDLVAAVLRAMKFRAVSTPPGRDRGVDIVAHPDPFGFETPLIKVQVKHRKGSATGPEVRSFLGTLRSGENGIFVSTGGFTSDAELEKMRSLNPVALLDRDSFITLLLEYYDTLEPEFKAKIPLRRIWIPTV